MEMSDLFEGVDQRAPITAPGIIVTDALTLTQPWATLMDLGAKLNETRSWPTHRRGWIGIHAAKGFPRDCRDLCMARPFARVLIEKGGYTGYSGLPTACLIGVTRILECVRTEKIRDSLTELELSFGDYSDRRWAFRTAGYRRLRAPIPMKGALSFWKMPQAITEADLA
jgi:hypothetical protein